MSYQVGLGKAPRFAVRMATPSTTVRASVARFAARPIGVSRTTPVGIPAATVVRGRVGMIPHPIHTTQTLEGLEFSLRPPKWLRKAQPGKILAKAAIPLAVGAALLIPGVAPLVGAAAGTIFKGVKTVASKVLPLFGGHPGAATNPLPGFMGPIQVPVDMGVQPVYAAAPPAVPISYQPSDNTMPTTVTAPAAPPDFANIYQQAQVASSQGTMTYDAPAPNAPAPGAGINPLFVVGGIAALALFMAAQRGSQKKGGS